MVYHNLYLKCNKIVLYLIIVTFTCGGVIKTLNLEPTNNLTVAVNLVLVFITWGGCFSMMKVLKRTKTLICTITNKHLTPQSFY